MRHSATSASLPGSSEPSSSSRPRQRAPSIVPSASAARAVSAAGPPRRRATSSASRTSAASSPASLDAAPSTPRPTGAPAAVSAATGAMPAPRRAFELGQCATPVPVAPNRATSASLRCTQCASHTSSPEPAEVVEVLDRAHRRTAPGRTPPRRASRRGGCAGARRGGGASSAASAISPRVTQKGEHGASATRTIAPGDGSWKRSIAASQAASIASRSSTTSSGGSPPSRAPEVHRAAARVEAQPDRGGRRDLDLEQVARGLRGRRSGGRSRSSSPRGRARPGRRGRRPTRSRRRCAPRPDRAPTSHSKSVACCASPRVAHW